MLHNAWFMMFVTAMLAGLGIALIAGVVLFWENRYRVRVWIGSRLTKWGARIDPRD